MTTAFQDADLAFQLDAFQIDGDTVAELLARIAELEAQLAAAGRAISAPDPLPMMYDYRAERIERNNRAAMALIGNFMAGLE